MLYLALAFYGGALMHAALMTAGLVYATWFAKPNEELDGDGLFRAYALLLCLLSAGTVCVIISFVASWIIR
jgi:hypothetical protein